MSIVINILLAFHVIVSLFIILFVLMQRPKSEGLGAAFGGGMTENLFGTGATNALQTITRWLGGIFFALSLLLSLLYIRQSTVKSRNEQRLTAPTVIPKAEATPAPATPESAIPLKTETSSPEKPATPEPAAPAKPESAAPAKSETPAPAKSGAPAKPDSAVPAKQETPVPAKSETPATASPAPAAEKPAGKPAN